jgi:probable F420-dependent oxidoreductase
MSGRPISFGVTLPHRWTYASPQAIAEIAREAEALGYSSVWVTDHIVVPVHRPERGHIFYEALMTLAYVSAITERVRLGTTVLIASARHPVLLAKQLATLDVLSRGRLIVGVGTGWIPEELEALGVPWAERGRRLDEAIQVMRTLWASSGPVSFEGRYVRFRDMLFEPRPIQIGGPPIWVGGMTDPSLRRAARWGDGWLPWAVAPEELAWKAERIRSWRNGRPLTIGLFLPADVGRRSLTEYIGAVGERHVVLSGMEEEVREQIARYCEAGCEHLILSFRDVRLFRDDRVDLLREQMRWFAREVMPAFRPPATDHGS